MDAEAGKRGEVKVSAEVASANEVKRMRVLLDTKTIVSLLLQGRVLLLDVDSKELYVVKRRIRRFFKRKGINTDVVHFEVEVDGARRYAICTAETFEKILEEDQGSPV